MARIKRIIVNKHKVKANQLHGTCEPVLSVQQSDGVTYGSEIDIVYRGKVIGTFKYRPDKPLKCGASVFFETYANVDIR